VAPARPPLQLLPVPEWIEKLPKAELHLHLEGVANAEILFALAQERGRKVLSVEALQKKLSYKNFLGFLLAFKYVVGQLNEPEDYAFLLRKTVEALDRQNVLYAEIMYSAGGVLLRKKDPDRIFAGLREEQERLRGKHKVEIRWLIDAVRNFGKGHVEATADYAIKWKKADPTVVGFGVGGEERVGPAKWFRKSFNRAREAGLRIAVHAGETGGPKSIWQAINDLGAERIGHGLAAIKDPELLAYLKEKQITIECSPTSNVRTGALKQHTKSDKLSSHPILAYHRQDIPVTLNTDDPGLFDTTLNQEYARAHALGLTREELITITKNAFQESFLHSEEKLPLLGRFRAETERLPA
jgi:adenosine deaminase